MNCNAQSIATKIDDLTVSLNTHNVDIACITESWLSSSVPDSAVNINGYTIVRNDRSQNIGGGVCLYIKSSLSYKVWADLNDNEIESLWISIRPRKMPRATPQILIGGIYMPPGCPARPRKEKEYITHILSCLDTVTRRHPSSGIIIMGDFNHMKDNLLKRYPLTQTVKSPTHGTSILDCVYSNISKYYATPTIHPGLGLCHHFSVICTPLNLKPNRKAVIITKRVFTHGAKSKFTEQLKCVNWIPLYKLASCQQQWEYFHGIMLSLLDKYLPIQTSVKYETDKPWITSQFKNMVKVRQHALKSGNLHTFRLYRNRVNRACKTLRSSYYNRNVNGLRKTNPRMWWKKTDLLINRNKGENAMHALAKRTTGGDITQLCNDINVFFHSVSSHLDPLSIPPINTEQDVPNKYIISITEVEHVLMKTDITKSPGPDGIPNWILHDLAGLISRPICCIFNSSIREGSVPSCWKRADVVPIPKSNPPRSIETDLRPISLTPVLSKQLESFIGKWMLESIKEKIDFNQYGGLRGTSTTHALVDLLQNWHNIIHTNKTVRILYIDFRKAFDSVNHVILLDRFRELGVHPVLISWLHSFLYQRQQRVKIGDEVSSWLTMKGAVPQGSWLGPLCFIVYVNKIEAECGMRIHKYIDDITITEQITNGEVSHLQKSLDSITEWSSTNSMKINGRKTKEMTISFKKTKPQLDPITHEGIPLECVDNFKLLGIWVSNNMTWKYHVEHIIQLHLPDFIT